VWLANFKFKPFAFFLYPDTLTKASGFMKHTFCTEHTTIAGNYMPVWFGWFESSEGIGGVGG